jgi:hypothetical protein
MFQNGTTEVSEEAILAKNIVIGPRLAPGLRQSREKNKEPKLSISIILRARMKFLRTTVDERGGCPVELLSTTEQLPLSSTA